MSEDKIKKIFVVCFIIIIFFFMITTIFNDKKVSEVEKRKLATFPKFTIDNLYKKKYYDNLTSAFSDQLELRNYLVKGYFLFQFQRYSGTAVKGKHKQLYSAAQKEPNAIYYKNLRKTIENVNKESKKINAKFIFLSVPRKDAYMTKDLPRTYVSSENIYKKQVKVTKETLSDDIIFIDAYDVYKKNNIYNCYYSNDHHITPRCAYLLYKEINKYTNTKTYDFEKEFKINKTIVNGSFNRQFGQTIKSKPEDLYLTPRKEINYKRYENNKLSKIKVFGKGNSYATAYMGNDMAYTRVERNIKGENIMFVGSSYTNILEALSVPSYNRMLSIDYRHNKSGHSIDYYVDKYDIDYVVFVPAQSNNSYSIDAINLHLGK